MQSLSKPTKQYLDSANVCIYYQYDYKQGEEQKKGQTILLLGKRHGGFYDYYSNYIENLSDSLYYVGGSSIELMGKAASIAKQIIYKTPIVFDLDSMRATVQMDNVNTYQYTQYMPIIDWHLTKRDTLIAGVSCKGATCLFGGREWIAYYAPNVHSQYGPYLFSGLPGLIFYIRDTKSEHSFTLNGLTNLKMLLPIYLKDDKNIIKTTRDKARKAVKNEHMDIIKAFQAKSPGIIFPDDVLNEERSRPYNPIELQ